MKERLKKFFIVVLSMMLSLTSLFLPIQSTKVNAAAVEPSTGNIYYIKNKNSGLYLQVANNSSNSGSNVIQANGTGAEGQRWILEKNSSGTYRLHPATDMTGSVSLDVANASSSNGANIGIFKNNGCSAQNFKLVKADNNNGYYLMTETTNFNSCVEVNRASKNNGANVIQYKKTGGDNQIWYFENAPWPSSGNSGNAGNSGNSGNSGNQGGSNNQGSTGNQGGTSNKVAIDGTFPNQELNFVNAQNGLMMAGSSLNKEVVSNNSNSTINRWVINYVGQGVFRIVNVNTGYVLAPYNNNTTEGASVVTTGSVSNNAQYWMIQAVKNDAQGTGLYYTLVNYANKNLALTANDNGFKLTRNNKTASQSFRINSYGLEGFGGYSKDMYGREKACTIGGVLGQVVKVNNVSELQRYASGSTPYTIVINNNISANSLTKVNVGKNKTFIGSYVNKTLYNIHFRNISNSGNNIYKNITFSHDVRINNNDDIQMYVSDGPNYWLDHCTWTGHDMNKDANIHHNDTDKFVYVGVKASFVTISGCNFGGHKYGLILGYPQDNGGGTYDGYPCMTICNNYFHSTITRAPGLMRYGNFHVYNNYIYDFNIGFTPYTNCTIYSEKNRFEKGYNEGSPLNGNGNNSKFVDYESTTDQNRYKIYNIGRVNWNPANNYGYRTRSSYDAKTWVLNNAGSKSSRLAYSVD